MSLLLLLLLFFSDYKCFPGFFPHAAGKIASNGPYEKVSKQVG
jgi:hypothetical protein